MSEGAPHDFWYKELCKARRRHPHPPQECVSIASSSPVSLWYCQTCHQTYLALRHIGYICEGGFPDPFQGPPPAYFGTRRGNMRGLDRISYHSDETGTEEAVEYHHDFISRFTHYK